MAKKRKAGSDEEDELEDDLEDEDFDGEEEDEEEDAGKSKKKGGKGKKKKGKFTDDDDEEEDSEDEDEGDGGRKKKRKTLRNQFIDDIADVEDDEEEEEDDEEDGDLIDDRDEIVNEEAVPRQGHADYRRLNYERERDERSAEEIAREYEERMAATDVHGGDYGPVGTGYVEQQAMLPTINDPKLWLIHCRPGHERELCTQLLQKYYSRYRENAPLSIKSAVCLDHLKGYVYIEADKEASVREAIKGLRTVFVSKGVQLVPLDQMVDAITVNRKAKVGIARDSWVRVRNGLYKDDLAKVVDVDTAAQKATVLLIPRLDLHAMAERSNDAEARKKNPFGRTGPVRPPPKPFNAEEARNLALAVQRTTGVDGQVMLMMGTHRFVNGYTQRDIALKSLNLIEGVPPMEEFQRFQACGAAAEDHGRGGGGAGLGHTGDLSSLVAALPTGTSAPKSVFVKGDLVVLVKGELQGVEAIVDSTRDDGKIMVKPNVEGFDEAVDFDAEDLRKVFKVGDHVRIIHGPYTGEIGIVLQVNQDDDQCIIISDATRNEIKTFGRDMTTTDVSTTSVEVLGQYQLHDLVQLDQHTAGVIINIQRESARVLTTASAPDAPDIRIVRATDIQRGLKTRNMKASDMFGNEVSQGEYVHFSTGPANARSTMQQGGSVSYVWRGHLFLKSNEFMDTGGFICVRANKCKIRGAKALSNMDAARQVAGGAGMLRPRVNNTPGGSKGFEYMPASPSQYAIGPNSQNGPRGGYGAGPGGPAAGGGGFRPPPPRMAGGPQPGSYSGAAQHAHTASALVGKTVKVAGGQYNGYRGRVKHETATHVQLELDAISGRVVTVDKKQVREDVPGGARAARPPAYGARPGAQYGSQGSEYDNSYGGSQYGTRTPLHPSQTPLHPSMTPAHYSSALTPSHAPYTPMHHAPTPMDDNYYMLNQTHPDDRGPAIAPTPNMASPYTPAAAYTPAAPTPQAWEPATAPTPALDTGAGAPPTASTPGLAPTPGAPTAPTPFLSAPTPGMTPGDGLGATPALLGATPGTAPTPHVNNAYTPHIADTPALPASTPGPEAAMYASGYTQWTGLVVRVMLGADAGQVAVVQRVEGSTLHIVKGTLAGDTGSFLEDPGAVEEAVPGESVELARPEKGNKVRVLYVPDNPKATGAVGFVKGVIQEEFLIALPSGDVCIAGMGQVGRLAQ